MANTTEYGSAARSLAVNEPSPPSTPMLEHGQPAWNRRRSSVSTPGRRGAPRSRYEEAMQQAREWTTWGLEIWQRLPWWQRISGVVVVLAVNVLIVLFWVYNESLMEWLQPKAQAWSERSGGWVLIWLLIFVCGFPPVVGYSTMLTVAGFVYGVPKGWLIAATANVAGSLAAFVVCRRYLGAWAERKLASGRSFQALSLVLKHDGIKLLTMIRLCPLPYSASNGALSTFQTVSPQAFATATALATPKLFIHVFVGSKFNDIGKGGHDQDATSKAVNYISIAGSMVLGAVTGWLIASRMQARTRQLEAEEQSKLEEREAALAHPDVFADDDAEDAEDLDDRAIHSATHSGDDIDFLDDADSEPYRDESGGQGKKAAQR